MLFQRKKKKKNWASFLFKYFVVHSKLICGVILSIFLDSVKKADNNGQAMLKLDVERPVYEETKLRRVYQYEKQKLSGKREINKTSKINSETFVFIYRRYFCY